MRIKFTLGAKFFLILLVSSKLNAMILQEFEQLNNDMKVGYVLGVFEDIVADTDNSKSDVECLRSWGVIGANKAIDKYSRIKSEDSQAGGLNVSLILALSANSKCGTVDASKMQPALTLRDFSNKPRDFQTGYVVGIIDHFIVDAKYAKERTECIENWGLLGGWNYLLNYYNTNPTSENVLNDNPAKVIRAGAKEKCGEKRRDLSQFKTVK
jgi:hypothetical protein